MRLPTFHRRLKNALFHTCHLKRCVTYINIRMGLPISHLNKNVWQFTENSSFCDHIFSSSLNTITCNGTNVFITKSLNQVQNKSACEIAKETSPVSIVLAIIVYSKTLFTEVQCYWSFFWKSCTMLNIQFIENLENMVQFGPNG